MLERTGEESAPKGRLSLAQHGAEGGVLGEREIDQSPGKGRHGFSHGLSALSNSG